MSMSIEQITAAMKATLLDLTPAKSDGLVDQSKAMGAEEAMLNLQLKLEIAAAKTGQLVRINLD